MITFIPGFGFKSSIWQTTHFASDDDLLLDFPVMEDVDLEVVANLMAKKITRKTVLIGWSMGGLVSIKMASLFPEKISRLVLLASGPCFTNDRREFNLEKFYSLVSFPTRKRLSRFAWQNPCEEEYLTILFESNLSDEFSKLSLPITLLHGGRDAIWPINEKAVLSINSRVKIVSLPNASHAFLFGERNDRITLK